jgi:hypothetical protein
MGSRPSELTTRVEHKLFFDLFESFLLFCPPREELLLMFEMNQWQQRLHSPYKVRYKMMQVIYLTKQLFDVCLAHWFSNLSDGLNILGVNLYAVFMYYNPKNLLDVTPKAHLNGFIRSPYFVILSNDNFESVMCSSN